MRQIFQHTLLSFLALILASCSPAEESPYDLKQPQASAQFAMKLKRKTGASKAHRMVSKSKKTKAASGKLQSYLDSISSARIGEGSGGLQLHGGGPGGGGTGLGGIGTRGVGRSAAGGYGAGSGGLGVRSAARAFELPPATQSERFKHEGVNDFVRTNKDRLSTFAIDVDTASYSFAKRYLRSGHAPPAASVRVEEWVNSFGYDYARPKGDVPFAIHVAGAPSPYAKDREILRVGIQGKDVSNEDRKPTHLVFLVDVSGSMQSPDKLPLAQKSLHMLVEQMRPQDSIALITYAGNTREALPALRTTAKNKEKIRAAIDALAAGGSTAMHSGLKLAYDNAHKNLRGGNISRVIVLSDGDANVGLIDHKEMFESIRGLASEGVKLSTVGFGTGNFQDHRMEQLADAGDGNYSYIESLNTARRVFVEKLTGTLQVIAKDVKIQVEFDPKAVKRYRLIGYENRDVADKDFRNDKVDAGEIGAGHTVTALYEIERVSNGLAPLGMVRVRYKQPRGQKAKEVASAVSAHRMLRNFEGLDHNTRFAVSVALAAEIFRESPYAKGRTFADVLTIAKSAVAGSDEKARMEFVGFMNNPVRQESPQRATAVSTGMPIVYGALDKEIIRRIVRENAAAIKYCYERELTNTPGLQGKVTMKWVIGGNGRVQQAQTAATTMNNRKVESCMARRIKSWRYPKPKGGGIVVVNYPFVFQKNG